MDSMTFPVKTSFDLTWTLVDTAKQPISNATMTADLYAGRSMRDPNGVPGTVVPPIQSLAMPCVNVATGLYLVTVPGTLDPPLDGVGYVLVINATVSGIQVYHAEQPVVIQTVGDSIDLTTVGAVRERSGTTSTTDDDEIQSAITGFSRFLLNWSGMSTLNSILALDEYYDGNGNDKLFLRTYPIISVNFVKVNGSQIPVSAAPPAFGVYIGQSKKYLGMRGAFGNFTTFPYPNYSIWGGITRKPAFLKGSGNIEVSYTAGYPDTPPDLEWAVRCVVAINYKRKGWQDQASRVVQGGGTQATTRYRDWDWPPEHQLVFDNYTRQAFIV